MGAFFTKLRNQIAKNFKKKHCTTGHFLKNILRAYYKKVNDQARVPEQSVLDDTLSKCNITRTKVINDYAKCLPFYDDHESDISGTIPLSSMSQGDAGKISHLLSKNDLMIKKLISMGFVPGRNLKLSASVFKDGARIVEIGETLIAIDKDTASAIYVSLT